MILQFILIHSKYHAIDNGREYQCRVVINASPPVYGNQYSFKDNKPL